MRRNGYLWIATLIVVFLPMSVMAQPGDPETPAPFGFIEVLAVAGMALGGRRVYKNRK
ncbi:hypothetical protein [Phaeocystidibacter marisrubri]|uniref:hypothetical protein n=1 Tax=Phaeocystidibacter marisrubri TaxID=1577780 RepID=UPI001478E8CB|nr:hypothetical protein [Phaeocystidibacter marisrubri]